MDLSPGDISLIVTGIAWLFAGFVVIVTGMGGPLLALPLMAPFVELPTIILVACFVSVPSDILVTIRFFKYIDWKKAWLLSIGSLPGVWAGVLVLKHVPLFWMQLGLGVLLLVFLAWQLLASEEGASEDWDSRAGLLACGAASGFFNGSVGLAGPPLAVCAWKCNWDKDTARGVFGFVFVVAVAATVVLDLWHGLVTETVWWHILVALPAMLIGMAAGLPASKRISQALFRRVLLLVVLAGALTLLYKALLV
ncbi:MAG: sulfite exporter TauE/SafE family protein [Desulfovibrionaceae bacterium]|nr:sulfite exporter TauE/SafE family protein [Desulfovibrionaceae bacterium]